MGKFDNKNNRVLSFMEEVQLQKEMEKQDEAFKDSEDYKLKCLDKGKDEAKGVCLDMVFSKLYKDAIPLNDDYKVARGEDLDAEFKDFINDRCPEGMEYYVKEGIRKGSPVARKIMEGVEKIVEDKYHEKSMHPEEYSADDMVFRMDDDTEKKIDVLNKDLELSDISEVIKDNVKKSAISEITRAKKEKEDVKNLEKELADDVNVQTEEQVQEAMEFRGLLDKRDFQPTLFQGIMIGKTDKVNAMMESGMLQNEYIYDTLSDYGMAEDRFFESVHFATPGELAFVESVKEYTKLNILKALKLESFNAREMREMANDYAYR